MTSEEEKDLEIQYYNWKNSMSWFYRFFIFGPKNMFKYSNSFEYFMVNIYKPKK